jgi:hypothetical protein
MRDYLLGAVAGAALALLGVRACEPPSPAVPGLSEEERAAHQADRDAAIAHAEAAVAEVRADADRLRELPLYERLEELVPPAVIDPPRRAASVSGSAVAVKAAHGQVNDTPPAASDRCHPDAPGWARCPEPVLDRLSLLVVDERQRADVAEIRLDEERALRRIDADEWAAKEGRYLAALADARPAPAWKLPVGIASGGAIVGGLVLAASGHPEAGLVIAGAGAVGAVVASW